MAQVMASVATGVLAVLTDKLGAMLTDKYGLATGVKQGIRFLRDELSTMEAVLRVLADKDDDDLNPLAKDWRSKVRELSYDIEDCIDRFMLDHSHGDGASTPTTANFVHKAIRMVKKLFKDRGIAEEIRELKRLVSEQSERGKRYYDINQCLTATLQPKLLDPRALALFQESRDLVGIDGPREEIIQLLKCEDMGQDRVVSIHGIGGQGKTTLAKDVYCKVTQAFDCRALVFVSQTPDIKKILRDILSQISKDDNLERLETEQLIRKVKDCLKDKRYFIVIDDIWSVSAWDDVRCALPLNDYGSRIITTTRKKEVAESCCKGIAAQMYEAKKLSDEDSQTLFFKRLFCSREDCPQDLRKVSSDILRKCGGLPLAIISIAGLLANKNQMVEDWDKVFRSIAAAVDRDSPYEKMRRILLLSYFDLPHHLKSCLIYLSVFPEDYLIDCQQLILLWVAEGLIPGQGREDMERVGRIFLIQLINRSLVQPTKVGVDGTTVKECRVHDIILEFIVSKAVEDNFVTIWNGNGFSENYYSSNQIRRLSIQKDISARAEETTNGIKHGAHIRSISSFGYGNSVLFNKHGFELFNSQVLRVVNIECVAKELSLGHVKSLGQLKYLRIQNDYGKASKLPEGIEKLQHLETLDVFFDQKEKLDVGWTNVEKLPTSIIHLQRLVRLFVPLPVRLPDGIRNLQVLEELSEIDLGIQSTEFIQGLGDLTNLKVLQIFWPSSIELRDMKDDKEACISALSRVLRYLRELRVWNSDDDATCSFMASCVPSPPPLQKLSLDTHNLNRVGPHISSLVNLTSLFISVSGEAGKEGINILASLPMLRSLKVRLSNDEDGDLGILYPRHAISRQGFQRLVKFHLRCLREAALEFEQGAMPKLQRLKLFLRARCQFKYGEGGVVLGLQNLGLRLQHVAVEVGCEAAVADEVEALEDDIRGAAAVHPNRPILQVERVNQHLMVPSPWVQQASIRPCYSRSLMKTTVST